MFKYLCILLVIFACLTSCASRYKFDRGGLSFVKLGDAMPDLSGHKLKGQNLRDTIFNEGDYQWQAAILDYADGKVYIEEDFWGNGLVNRIRIQSAALHFNKQLMVGMTAADAAQLPLNWQVLALPDYEMLDVSPVEYPEIHLLFPVQENEKSLLDQENVSFKDLKHTAKVKAIVIM